MRFRYQLRREWGLGVCELGRVGMSLPLFCCVVACLWWCGGMRMMVTLLLQLQEMSRSGMETGESETALMVLVLVCKG